MRSFLLIFLWVCLPLAGPPLLAGDSIWPLKKQQTPEPSFYIDGFRVISDGNVSDKIILSELRLDADNTYSESQLRNAINRILRLPFIQDARFALAKGSKRGQYLLEIHLEETRPFFFSLGTSWFRGENAESTSIDSLNIGYRHYLGSSAVLFAGVKPDWDWTDGENRTSQYTVGLAHYNLFNRNVFASLELVYSDDDVYEAEVVAEDRTFIDQVEVESQLSPVFQLSIPITRNSQWLKFDFRSVEADSDQRNPLLPDEVDPRRADRTSFRLYQGSWEWNTLNDNLLPTSGRLLDLGSGYETRELESPTLNYKSRYAFIKGKFAYLFEGFYGHSFRVGAETRLTVEERNIERFENGFRTFLDSRDIASSGWVTEGGYALDLFRESSNQNLRDLRLYLNANLFDSASQRIVYFGDPPPSSQESGYTITAGATFRSRSMIINFSASYIGDRE
jgi:outer membrane protein assembly factor BamA